MTHLLAVLDALDSSIRAWGASQHWPIEYALRLVVAAVAGGLVGIEREVRGREAGFRTNLLVAVASALVMIVSISFAERPWNHPPGEFNLNMDVTRIASGIMMGIGFLGAGAIVKNGMNVRGLTTAAGLWCVAAVGMAAGFGLYTITAIATAIVFGALWFLEYLDRLLPKKRYVILTVRRGWKPGAMDEAMQMLKRAGVGVSDVSLQRTADLSCVDLTMRISFYDRNKYVALERQLEQEPGYELLSVEEP